jgi:DNA-binding transcriptional MerR regulator
MKGGHSNASKEAPPASGATPVRARSSELLDDAELVEIERAHPQGLTSRQIVDLFEGRGIRFSEATLRKYVQLGLLPRSVRVGRKGKHRGSCGLYPANVIRRVNLVKGMMAEDLTIEQIQRSFVRFKDEIDTVEKGLRDLIAGFERQAKGPALEAERRRDLEREINEAKRAAGELIRRISGLEVQLSARAHSGASGTAVGGGSDLY